MLDEAAGAWTNFIDTADAYPPGAGAGGAEIIVGRWLSKRRAEFILATKGGGRMGPAAWDAGNSRPYGVSAMTKVLVTIGVHMHRHGGRLLYSMRLRLICPRNEPWRPRNGPVRRPSG
jgi:aryl-alcohol dehydrogenase-like predicted oxidoreductase